MSTEPNSLAAPPQGQEAPQTPAPAAKPDATPVDGQESAGAPQEQGQDADSAKTGTPKGVQKRLDELRRREADAQRVNERLIGLLEKAVLSGKAPSAADVTAPDQPPRREDFATYEEYADARADWKAAEAFKTLEAKAERTRQQQQAQARESTWNERVEKTAAKYDDFADVVFSDSLAVTPVMAEAMKDSDIGAEIAYHLGKNPAEAQRISALPPVAQVREIGKIEARLSNVAPATPAKPVPKAPAPIEPVGSGKSSAGTGMGDLAKLPMDEYIARRKSMGARWAGK